MAILAIYDFFISTKQSNDVCISSDSCFHKKIGHGLKCLGRTIPHPGEDITKIFETGLFLATIQDNCVHKMKLGCL